MKIFDIGQGFDRLQFHPHSAKQYSDFWSTNYEDLKAKSYHQNRLFRKTIFRPLGGAVPPNFYMR